MVAGTPWRVLRPKSRSDVQPPRPAAPIPMHATGRSIGTQKRSASARRYVCSVPGVSAEARPRSLSLRNPRSNRRKQYWNASNGALEASNRGAEKQEAREDETVVARVGNLAPELVGISQLGKALGERCRAPPPRGRSEVKRRFRQSWRCIWSWITTALTKLLRSTMVGASSAFSCALHADVGLLAEPGRCDESRVRRCSSDVP